jgi:hypothetical protein
MPDHRRFVLSLLLCCAVPPLQAQVDLTEGTLPDKIFRHGIEGRPVTGQLVVNGYPMPFPAGSYAGGAQQASPGVYGGRFYFPPSTLQSNVNGLGLVTLNTQLVHQGVTSNSLVLPEQAGIQMTDVYLRLTSATVSGVPVSLGSDCSFGPILISAQGIWNISAAAMSGSPITIPPVAANACGGYATTLNNSIAGSNNSVSIVIDIE